jgi:hypothetical protein
MTDISPQPQTAPQGQPAQPAQNPQGGPAANVQPQATAAPAAQPQQPPSTSWRDSLPEQLREDPSLANFRDVADVARAYLETKRALSGRTDGKVTLPGPGSSSDEIQAFLTAWGVPEAPDKYESPQFGESAKIDPNMDSWFRDLAYKTGINQKQFHEIYSQFVDLQQQTIETLQFQMKQLFGTGRQFQDALKDAEYATRYLPEGMREHFRAQIGLSPDVTILLNHFGKGRKEDTMPENPRYDSGSGSFQSRVAQIDAQLMNPSTPPSLRDSLLAEKRALFQRTLG